MHISELQLTDFKSFKSLVKMENISENINIIVGKNGSGKSNIITAFSTILNPSKIITEQKHALINESNAIDQTKAVLQLTINNNDRFPVKETFVLRREFELKKDKYYIVEKDQMSKIDDPIPFFESANITNNNYFVVQQGKINHLALMNNIERLDLIKEIAGANVYEKDRKHCIQLLSETERSNEKTSEMLKTIDEKLVLLQKEKAKLIELENLERERQKIEVGILKKEQKQLDLEIEKLYVAENSLTDDSVDIDEVQEEIMHCKKQIEETKKTFNLDNVENIDINALIDEKSNFEKQKISLESQYEATLERVENNKIILSNTKLMAEVTKQSLAYCNTILTTKDFMDYTREFEKHKKALDDLTKSLKQVSNDSKVDLYKNLQTTIFERNRLWSEEKKLKEKRQEVYSDYLRLERTLAYSGGGKYKEYCNIKNRPGVHGCVFELLSVPEELFSAFESVAANTLFNVVVNDEDVATELCKEIHCRLTFIPLNRIKDDHEELQLEDAFLLSSKIACKTLYKPILNYVTKNTYLTSDIKTGFILSKAHNINIVTLDGDFISKKGFVSGGYDKKNSYLKDIKLKEDEIKVIDKKTLVLKGEINSLTLKIDELRKNSCIELKNYSKSEYDTELQILTSKTSILKSIIDNGYNEKTILQNIAEMRKKLKGLEAKLTNIENEIIANTTEITTLKYKKDIFTGKLNEKIEIYEAYEQHKKILELIEKMRDLERIERECSDKENKKIYQYADQIDDRVRNDKIKMDILNEKKINIMRKIGRNTDDSGYSHYSIKELYDQVKNLNDKMKKYYNINRKALMMYEDYYDQKNKLQERLKELQLEKVKIDSFIMDLDSKKTETVNITFKMIKDNFNYYFKKLSPCNNAELTLIEEGVSIKLNDDVILDLKKLSGGQKALIALSLIFSIQKIDPSPFYFFDEIDAHLDEQSRINVSKLIRELSHMQPCTQFFIVSFRKEMIAVGNKFYCVDFIDNTSWLREIDQEEAMVFVSDEVLVDEQ